MVRPDRHPEFPREIVEYLAGGSAFIVRLHGFQSCIAQRYCWHRLLPSRSALLTGGRRSLRRRECRPPLPGWAGFPPKSFQNTFGDLQLIELSTQLFSFGIEALDPIRILRSDSAVFGGRQFVTLIFGEERREQLIPGSVWSRADEIGDA